MNPINRRRQSALRLAALESLESRLFLAAHTWTGATSALWSDPTNWVGGAPQAAEANIQLYFPHNAISLKTTDDIAFTTPVQSLFFTGNVTGSDYSALGPASSGPAISYTVQTSGSGTLSVSGDIQIGQFSPPNGTADDVNNEIVNFNTPVTLTAGNHFITSTTAEFSDQFVFAGAVGQSGGDASITVEGDGDVSLKTANTFSGNVTLGAGSLTLYNNLALGAAANNSTVDVHDGASLGLVSTVLPATKAINIRGTGNNSSYGVALVGLTPSSNVVHSSSQVLGPVTLGGDTTFAANFASSSLFLAKPDPFIIAGSIGGTGKVTITNGEVDLNASNTFQGAFEVDSGATGSLGNSDALGDPTFASTASAITGGQLTLDATAGSVTIPSTKQLQIGKGSTFGSKGTTAQWNGPVTLTDVGTSNINVTSAGNTLSIPQGIAGTAGNAEAITKKGAGALVLSSAGSYTGGTLIAAGLIRIENIGALGTGIVSLQPGSSLQFYVAGASTFPNQVNVGGGAPAAGASANIEVLNSPDVGNPSAITFSALGGPFLGTTSTFSVDDPADDLFINGPLSGPGGLTKTGSGFLSLLGDASIYQGTTTVKNGTLESSTISGPIIIGDGIGTADSAKFIINNSFSSDFPDNFPVTIFADGQFDLGFADNVTVSTLTMTGGDVVGLFSALLSNHINVHASAAPSTISSYVSLQGGTAVFNIDAGATLAIPFGLKNNTAAPESIDKTGGGLLALGRDQSTGSDFNTSAPITVDNGTVEFTSNDALGDGMSDNAPIQSLTINANGHVIIDGSLSEHVTSLTMNGGTLLINNGSTLTVSGGVVLKSATINTSSTGTLVFAPGVTSNLTASGSSNISGNGQVDLGGQARTFSVASGGALSISAHLAKSIGASLNKTGTGRITYLGNGTAFTGQVNVQQGTFEVDGNLSLASMNVSSGATVSGTGAIGIATVSGTIDPGHATGASTPSTLSFAKLTLTSSAKVNLLAYSNGMNDVISVTGNLVLAGTLNLTSGKAGKVYTIMLASGTISGHFTTLLPSGHLTQTVNAHNVTVKMT